jgi:SAM-dependent methyltransferase
LSKSLIKRFYPEAEIDDFTNVNGTIQFYLKVKALYAEFDAPRVLDFGAGRGAWTETETSRTVRAIRDLRIGAGDVVAADVDPIVARNACSHSQVRLKSGEPLPFGDGAFDIVVADYVFEHIADPERAAAELLRVVRPGGWICARTVNKYGYVALAARLVPNALHTRFLRRIQPERVGIDVFPTVYALNSRAAIRRHFAPARRTVCFFGSHEPSYHFDNALLFGTFKAIHTLLPQALATGLCAFIQK